MLQLRDQDVNAVNQPFRETPFENYYSFGCLAFTWIVLPLPGSSDTVDGSGFVKLCTVVKVGVLKNA